MRHSLGSVVLRFAALDEAGQHYDAVVSVGFSAELPDSIENAVQEGQDAEGRIVISKQLPAHDLQ